MVGLRGEGRLDETMECVAQCSLCVITRVVGVGGCVDERAGGGGGLRDSWSVGRGIGWRQDMVPVVTLHCVP